MLAQAYAARGIRIHHHSPARLLHVLFQDKHLIVSNKAPGVLSQPDARTGAAAAAADDQLSLIREHIRTAKPGEAYVGLVHRLDRNVSGAMVMALRSKAAARLSYDFKHRLVSKTYVAMVLGVLRGQGTLEDTLVHAGYNVTRVKRIPDDEDHAPKALLHYKALHTLTHPTAGPQTLVQIDLVTGKKHQIRAQLAHLGHAIAGDVKYGAPGRFRDKSIALHCRSLVFRHPTVEVVADEAREQEGGRKPSMQRRLLAVHAPVPGTWRARFGEEVVGLIERMHASTEGNAPPHR